LPGFASLEEGCGTEGITDMGIEHLTRLKDLQCYYCTGITDNGIKHLDCLMKLNCEASSKISKRMKQKIQDRRVRYLA